MQIKHLDIPGVGTVPVTLPQSYAARLDLLSGRWQLLFAAVNLLIAAV